MRERVRQAMADAFGLPVDAISRDARADEIGEWDSLRHLELMLELELAFGIALTSDVIPELLSVDAIVDFLAAHGAAVDA